MAIAPRSNDELLRDVPVLSALPAADLHSLAELCEVRKVARGTPLFSEGQTAEGLFIVRTGEVKLTKSGRDGREQIVYLARPGRPIVEGLRFDGGAYPASAVAMRAATALLIANDAISTLGDRRPLILRTMIDLRARRSDKSLKLVSDLSLRTVPCSSRVVSVHALSSEGSSRRGCSASCS